MQMRCNHCGRLLDTRSDIYINDKDDSLGCGGCLHVVKSDVKVKCPICKVYIEKGELALCKRVPKRISIDSPSVDDKYEPVACIDCYTMVQAGFYVAKVYDAFEGVEWY